MTTLKDQVKAARKARRLSQEQLAQKAGVSTSTVTRLERGLSPEDGDAAERVLDALGLSRGRSLSAGQTGASTQAEESQKIPAMAQMVGRLQLPAGHEDYYTEMVEVALERRAPAEVFLDLARARAEAPPGARSGWWMRRLMDAIDAASAPKQRAK